MKIFICFTILILLTSGCTTASFVVKSSPDKADVFLSNRGQKTEQIGVTPLNLNASDYDFQNSAQITVQKEGYEDMSFLLPSSTVSQRIEINANLKETTIPNSCQQQSQSAEKVAKSVARSLFLLQTKKFEMAQSVIKNLITEYPNSATLWGLLGNAYYMDRQTIKALEAYENSLNLDPDSPETKRMVSKLRGLTSMLDMQREAF